VTGVGSSSRLAGLLLEANQDVWRKVVGHPFVRATADSSLAEAAFERWLLEDYAFVLGFRRFLAGLIALAPDEEARDVLAPALTPLQAEVELFRAEAARRELDLDAAEPFSDNPWVHELSAGLTAGRI
jgi:thiaminase/transcriptional activator TenA